MDLKEVERSNLRALRESLKHTGAVVAEVDKDLRYVWVDNPHPDFDPHAVVGKRDDELLPGEEAEPFLQFKRHALDSSSAISRVISVKRSDGLRTYKIYGYPIRNSRGKTDAILTVGFDASPEAGEHERA